MTEETPLALKEGRTCCFYVGAAGTVEAVTRNQERRERLAALDRLTFTPDFDLEG